jgi:predicted CXXCH cytochrome family protein
MSTDKRVLGGVLALVTGAAAALLFGAAPAYADNGPHQSKAATVAGTVTLDQMGADRCASCHRAHSAKSAYLLAASSQESLCFTCHGDGGTGATTNVQSGIAYGGGSTVDATGKWISANRDTVVAGALRGGGFDKAMIDSGTGSKELYVSVNATTGVSSLRSRNQVIGVLSAPARTTSSHLGGPNTIWGNGAYSATGDAGPVTDATTKLECGSCHDPHGNNQYRILKPIPVGSGATTGITIKDTVNKLYTTTNYWIAGDPAATDTLTTTYLGATSDISPVPVAKTQTVAVSSFQANVSAWCTQCHTRYLAASGSYAGNTGDSIFTYRHRSDSVSKGESSNPNCTQCHVAHGSNAVMSDASKVTYPGGTAATTDSRLLRVNDRGVCVMCHNV